jgi:glycosyltransferase involved in cell wall biosynthesis
VDKENGGHGSTINKGIQEAKGKYFKVVDADDWVLEQGMLELMNTLRKTDSDLVVSNFYWYHDKKQTTSVEIKEPFNGVEYGKEYEFDSVCTDMYVKMHGMTLKTEILKKIPKIDEHCYYVDVEYVLFPIPWIKTVTCIPDFVYMYRIGIPGQSMNINKMQKNQENFDRVLTTMFDFYQENYKKLTREKLDYINKYLGRVVASRFKIFLSFPYSKAVKTEMKAFDEKVKKNYPEIYHAVKQKAVLMLRKSGYRLYFAAQWMYKLSERMK